MADQLQKFIDHMRASGIGPDDPGEIIADDKPRRYRLTDDRRGVRTGSYQLSIQRDGFAVGWCRSFREGVTYPWHSKASRKATDEERAAWKAKADADRALRKAEIEAQAERAAIKAQDVWRRAARDGVTPYIARKGIGLHGARVTGDTLLVPLWSGKRIVGVQYIAPDGSKRFGVGTAKAGAWFAIRGDDVIVICEGFATGAAIREATGHSVVIAFDAGNLVPVARVWREREPDRRIVIAADNDQWTFDAKRRPDGVAPSEIAGDDPRWQEWRAAGALVNPGVNAAQQAAAAIGGAIVAVPDIPAYDAAKRTDWHDVLAWRGADAVRDAFAAAMAPRRAQDDTMHGDNWQPDYEPAEPDVQADDPFAMIRPLGHNDGVYYFFPRDVGQIKAFTPTSLGSVQNLVTMAPMDLWRRYFGGPDASERKIATAASVALIETCNQIGIYDPTNVRSLGAWMDDDKPVFNSGARVWHPGGDCAPPAYLAHHVYVMAPRILSPGEPLDNAGAARLLELCRAVAWKRSIFAYLVAGWIVTAQVGGALRWRPHIAITGETGSGKSWTVENIIKAALGDVYIERDGGSTEAKIRRDLSSKSIPLIMDEAEGDNAKNRLNMDEVLFLARKSSSGASIANYDGVFSVRSAFCFAAINQQITKGADLSRVAILDLKTPTGDSGEAFAALQRMQAEIITDDFPARLLGRTMANMPVLLANIEAFSAVLARIGGAKRFGDTFGTMVAGAFSLTSTRAVTPEQAQDWCERQDWSWTRDDNGESDSERLLAVLLAARLRYDVNGMSREASLASMIARAADHTSIDAEASARAMADYGVKLQDGSVVIATPNVAMERILRETPWSSAVAFRRALLNINGAEAVDKTVFGPAMRKRGVAIPMHHIMGDDPASAEVDLPFEDAFS